VGRLILSVFVLALSLSLVACSYDGGGFKIRSLYSDVRAWKVGDLLTVQINQSVLINQQASTKAQKNVLLQIPGLLEMFWNWLQNTIAGLVVPTTLTSQIKYADKVTPTGNLQRQNKIVAVVTVEVKKILPNGNFYIEGYQKVRVDGNEMTIKISGFVRPEDVSSDNSVDISKVGNAVVEISYGGPEGEKQTPGIITRILQWLF
jgi:flagellar L-ring protein precursor FlgH